MNEANEIKRGNEGESEKLSSQGTEMTEGNEAAREWCKAGLKKQLKDA